MPRIISCAPPIGERGVRAMNWRPEVTVAAVVARGGRFLLIEESINGTLQLNQPAGHVEEGETLLDAVVRETLEESAWRFTPQHLLGVYQWRNPAGRSFLRFAFTGTVSDHDATRPLDKGIVRSLWLRRDELLVRASQLRSPMVLRCVEDFLRGVRLPLDSVACLDLESAVRARAVSV